MYSVEITVEKDKVTGETRVLSSTTMLPPEPRPQGIKVYEDETKGRDPPHALRGSPPPLVCWTPPIPAQEALGFRWGEGLRGSGVQME